MKQAISCLAAALAILVLGSPPELAAQQPKGAAGETVLLDVDKALDKRTQIKPSLIPGAGNGLFALTRIAKGETIGELGGRLVTETEYYSGTMRDNHYIAALDECAFEAAYPFKYIDAREHGAPVSRINTAPREINGIETGFQNAQLTRLCKQPYIIFVALQDIEPGQEIWASYGPSYDYERFMYEPAVREFFCGRLKIDCKVEYTYEH